MGSLVRSKSGSEDASLKFTDRDGYSGIFKPFDIKTAPVSNREKYFGKKHPNAQFTADRLYKQARIKSAMTKRKKEDEEICNVAISYKSQAIFETLKQRVGK